MTGPEAQAPKVFVSYSWDDEEHRGWVHGFATRLRADGVDAELDQWDVHLGDPLPEFMERAVRENDFVLVICTPKYKERSDGRVGGVGYEGDIMTAEVFSTRNHRKFIPVLRRGGWSSAFPSWLHGKAGVDLRRDPYSEEQYRRLLEPYTAKRLSGRPSDPDPVGLAGEAVTETEPVPNMSPGIRPGQLPPFHELDEYTFQELCRDILDAEPSVATCEVYGTRGQAQYGIDLLAVAADGDGIEVGQCKCYENFTPRQIERVREEFFEHYGSHWQPRKVKRFILFVAGDLSSTQHQDKILEERDLFAAFGIGYEVWSAAQIRNKLRPRPDIVSTYLQPAEHWVRVICGTSLPAAHPAPAMQSPAVDWVNAVTLGASGTQRVRGGRATTGGHARSLARGPAEGSRVDARRAEGRHRNVGGRFAGNQGQGAALRVRREAAHLGRHRQGQTAGGRGPRPVPLGRRNEGSSPDSPCGDRGRCGRGAPRGEARRGFGEPQGVAFARARRLRRIPPGIGSAPRGPAAGA